MQKEDPPKQSTYDPSHASSDPEPHLNSYVHGSPRFISFEKFEQIDQIYSRMSYTQATFHQAKYPRVIFPCSGHDVNAITC